LAPFSRKGKEKGRWYSPYHK